MSTIVCWFLASIKSYFDSRLGWNAIFPRKFFAFRSGGSQAGQVERRLRLAGSCLSVIYQWIFNLSKQFPDQWEFEAAGFV